jgi:hypothetical protein
MADVPLWSHDLLRDSDGSYRLEILDERGERFPVARQISEGQARRLLRVIEQEAQRRGTPVADVIRDPGFMAPVVISLKRANGR